MKPQPQTFLEVSQIGKTYGHQAAVEDFSFAFREGETTTVLGPSGSGKSTLLWMIAGLTQPDRGRILWQGEDITALPAERRGMGLVMQHYALFPHLSVLENVTFGLRVRGLDPAQRRRRGEEYLDLVRMSALANRRVQKLSGGEQQRVALARALAIQPRLLLFDEPLAALDAPLREELRGELFSILRGLRMTAIYVTHDQIEAMALGQSMVVMEKGRLAQSGTPEEIYRHPANPFVAGFLGSANLFAGEVRETESGRQLELPFGRLAVTQAALGPCWAMFRPEHLGIVSLEHADFIATLNTLIFLGSNMRLQLTIANAPGHAAATSTFLLDMPPGLALQAGQKIGLSLDSNRLHLWPRTSSTADRLPHAVA